MNNIMEQALIADLGKLKGAHNNLANKMTGDMNTLLEAVRQCVAAITALETRMSTFETALGGRRQPVAAPPTAPGPRPAAAAPRPAAPAAPISPSPASWPIDGEEDADVVE